MKKLFIIFSFIISALALNAQQEPRIYSGFPCGKCDKKEVHSHTFIINGKKTVIYYCYWNDYLLLE